MSDQKKIGWTPIVVAIIGAIASITAAFATSYFKTEGTIKSKGVDIQALAEKYEDLDAKTNLLNQRLPDYPVGTIIASMIRPEIFLNQRNNRHFWMPADGRSVPSSSEYYSITQRSQLPDLRGVFLRGLNVFIADETNPLVAGLGDTWAQEHHGQQRTVGSYQNDSTKKPNEGFLGETTLGGDHKHRTFLGGHSSNVPLEFGTESTGVTIHGTQYASADRVKTSSDGSHIHSTKINNGGDKETRPKNVAVYFYIKIN